jgi:hypothetical protein
MLIEVLSVIVVAAALVYRFGPSYLNKRRTKDAADWPQTQATIQSAKLELVERTGYIRKEVPFFTFSYLVDNEYYSGRFGLRVAEDRALTLTRDWVGTTMSMRYDPTQPSVFWIPDEIPVDGFRVTTVREFELVSEH